MALFLCYFDSPEEAISRVTWVVGDVLDGESVAPFVEKVDTVYHCAAMVSFNGSDRDTLLETNIKGTESICKICLKRGVRLCFVSSIAALGDAPNESVVIDENTPEIQDRSTRFIPVVKGRLRKLSGSMSVKDWML
ncbi:MAG: NAD-dependent epimerase/dehydratase family protein [Butyricimonas faecihominis]